MIGPQASLASPRELPDSSPRVTPTPSGLYITWQAPEPRVNYDSEGYANIHVEGYELLDQPGVPRLPYSSVLVALPPDAHPVLNILSTTNRTQDLQAPLMLGDQPMGVKRDASGQVIGGNFAPITEETARVDEIVNLEPIGVVRGIHLARLTFYPVVQQGNSLLVISSLEIDLDFGPQFMKGTPVAEATDAMLSLLRGSVVNPQHVQSMAREVLRNDLDHQLQLAASDAIAVEVSDRGITDITYADLASRGLISGPVNLGNINLTRSSASIAYDIIGDTDSIFETGEAIRFFADPRFSRWTNKDTYLLDLDGASGVKISSRSVASASAGTAWAEQVFEENKIYTPGCYCAPIPAGRDGDRWVGYQLQRPGNPSVDIPFELPAFDRTKNATLKLWLIGFTDISADPDHKVNVAIKVNGTSVSIGSIQLNGKTNHEATFSISANSLPVGNYKLSLTIPENTPGNPVDGVWVDAFSIRYALSDSISAGDSIAFSGVTSQRAYTVKMSPTDSYLAYDITNPEKPQKLTGITVAGSSVTVADPSGSQTRDYLVTSTSAIQAPENLRQVETLSGTAGYAGADYVIISPAAFIPSLAPLVSLHQTSGLQVLVEDVQAVYDNFGGGRPLPSAIRDYLLEAYSSWEKTPLYVLLVGDGTQDPKQYLETSSATFIPPYLEVVDPWAGETAADNRYVTLDPIPVSEGDDLLPDMLIGRLPANSISELETMVSKIVAYAGNTGADKWKHQAIFVADNNDYGGGNFPRLSEAMINSVPANMLTANRLYFSSSSTPAAFRSKVNQAWNDGSSLLVFTGHSSIHQWAHEILFHLEDVPGLNNAARLPVLLEMTCFTGSFQIHDFPALDEELLRKPGGGAVAVWGPTGLGIASGHHWLAEGFMKNIYEDGNYGIGAAALAGKLNLASIGSHPDLIDTFTLLGDPAIKLVPTYQMYSPIIQN